MYKVFIDGKEGTTGLRINERLSERNDMEILSLSEADRKNIAARKAMINTADIVFLCLPDDAARESVSLAENNEVIIIDASTAHRTEPSWSYGFPELSPNHRENIQSGRRIAVPGCHASGFSALVYPLILAGLLPKNYPLSCFSITGYSGGGKKMIGEYETAWKRSNEYDSPRQYALTQNHKHLREMKHVCALDINPLFSPVVADFYSGMQVTIPLHTSLLNIKTSLAEIYKIYKNHYDNSLINITALGKESPFMAANAYSGKDTMNITVSGNNERVLLIATFDNLGKGASGAAVQCMNIALGFPETTGLALLHHT